MDILILTYKHLPVTLLIEHLFLHRSLCVPPSKERMMYMPKRINVTRETSTGRNTNFHDNYTGADMTRAQFVRQINNGTYENYHVRNINGVQTPVSNPDSSRNNNLG